MSAILSGLKFVATKRPQAMPAVQLRRNKLSNKLWEQIKLARSLSEGTTYAPMRLRTVRDRHTGEAKRLELPVRVRAWWFTSETGRVCVQVVSGIPIIPTRGNRIFPTHHRQGGNDGSGSDRPTQEF